MNHSFLAISRARTLLIAGLTASLTVLAPAMTAGADPVGPPVDEHFHEEDGGGSGDPYVEEAPDSEVADVPAEPYALEGLAPDPADLPTKWLQETPAEEITPSSAESLTLPKDKLTADAGESTMAVPAPPSKSLPSTLDAAPGWQYSYSCDPNDKRGMVAFAELVSKHYNRPRYTTSRSCFAGSTSQHHEGRAVDWNMDVYNSSDKAIGDAVAYWLTSNNGEMARRFGVQSVIWNKRSWYLYSPGSWRDYTGPSPHTDHLHISFTWDGAMKRTSWWTGRAVTTIDYGTCRVYSGQYAPRYSGRNTRRCSTSLPSAPFSSYPVTLPRANNSNVATAQRYMGLTGSSVDGIFGPNTLSTLLKYQDRYDLPWTGVLDKATWAFMEKKGVSTSAVSRISGNDRYETAAKVAALYPTGGDVYVTTGQNYPDALAAGARAGSRNDPILLTKANELPPSTVAQLKRIRPYRVYIVGGKTSINSSVYRSLEGYTGSGGVKRLGGSNRYGTAALVATTFSKGASVAYVATGVDYPDALAAAARAGHNDAPILLTGRSGLPAVTKQALRTINPGRITVVGSTSDVSSSVASQLRGYSKSGDVQRVSGDNEYEVAANLANYYPHGVDVVYVATSRDYPDALAGAGRAGSLGGPVVYVDRNSVPRATKDVIEDLDPERLVVLGGEDTIYPAVTRSLENVID
ncbi:MAG: cell wall-binding repeat-containing protein [Ornithinimicrobium sp.]